jgi:tricorn protease
MRSWLGFTADGTAVALASTRETDHGRSAQLYHASLSGGLPEKQMLARIFRGAYDSTGKRFAYIAYPPGYNGLLGGTAGWRGYRGGAAPAIQIVDIGEQSLEQIPGEGSNNIDPFWIDGQVYFLSDRDAKVFNVFRYDPASGSIEKLSSEDRWDVRGADGRGSTIVYEAGGRLKRLDLRTGGYSIRLSAGSMGRRSCSSIRMRAPEATICHMRSASSASASSLARGPGVDSSGYSQIRCSSMAA